MFVTDFDVARLSRTQINSARKIRFLFHSKTESWFV